METVRREEVTRIRVGQKVKVKVPVDVLRTIQEGHGGFTPKMCESMTLQGEVMEVTEKGDLRVKYPNNVSWTLNPEAVDLIGEPVQQAQAQAAPEPQVIGDQLGYAPNFVYNWDPAPTLEARECLVCSESEELCKLEPCGHKLACFDCTSRLKKCFNCHGTITRRLTCDGCVVDYIPKSRRPTFEQVQYLELKVKNLEDNATCNICLENPRNRVFQCGHTCCNECLPSINGICHMCRTPFRNPIHLY